MPYEAEDKVSDKLSALEYYSTDQNLTGTAGAVFAKAFLGSDLKICHNIAKDGESKKYTLWHNTDNKPVENSDYDKYSVRALSKVMTDCKRLDNGEKPNKDNLCYFVMNMSPSTCFLQSNSERYNWAGQIYKKAKIKARAAEANKSR